MSGIAPRPWRFGPVPAGLVLTALGIFDKFCLQAATTVAARTKRSLRRRSNRKEPFANCVLPRSNDIAYENRWKMSRFSVGSMMETGVVPHLR